jgi:hypothetical protein
VYNASIKLDKILMLKELLALLLIEFIEDARKKKYSNDKEILKKENYTNHECASYIDCTA